MTTLRAQYDGKVLVPLDPVDLPQGKVLELRVQETAESAPGSPAAVIRALEAPRIATPEDMDELDRSIAEARRPARQGGMFDEEAAGE